MKCDAGSGVHFFKKGHEIVQPQKPCNDANAPPQAKSATIVLRGGGHQFIEEMDRSIHDAIMVVMILLMMLMIVIMMI